VAYSMHLKSKPTGGNQRASAELAPTFARDALTAISSAAEALNALSKTTDPTPEQMLSAVLTWRAGQAEIQGLERELLGCAILGGAAASTTATKLSVRPQTLSAWLAGTVSDLRGRELKRVGDGKWEPLQPADLHVSDDEPQNPAEPAAASPSADGPSTSQDAAGTGSVTVGTGQVRSGTSAPDLSTEELEAEVRAQGIDVNKVIADSIGGW